MKKVYISMGSNIGNKKENLDRAVEILKEKLKITRISSYYETEPVGYKEQDWFINIVLEALTDISPHELLEFCQGIEKEMKRVKTIRFGPRIIDVDILLYEGFESDEEELTIPHPRMKERAFVMHPLHEIAPELIIGGESIGEIIKNLKGEQIRKSEDL
jgi:2-amino-4-hydroxy-6-hydroxymethyldihydropteridine diphosphokinase